MLFQLTAFGDLPGTVTTLLTDLFHWSRDWTLDTTDSRTHIITGVKPEDYPRPPLFKIDPAATEQSVLLNQVFWLVFDDSLSRWSMACLFCNTEEEVEHLAKSHLLCICTIAATKSGSALPAVPKISKNLVAYMAGLDAVSP
jgi:hypothetical protein